MKCEDIFFEKVISGSIFSIHLSDCMKKHYALAVTYPQGKIAYLKQAQYDVMEKIMERQNVITRSWHESNLCLDMFTNENKRKNLFDYLDYLAQQDLTNEINGLQNVGIGELNISETIDKITKSNDKYYCNIIGYFWEYYSQYVAITNEIDRLEKEETNKEFSKQEITKINVDRHDEPRFRKIFHDLKQQGIIDGTENVFLDMCAGDLDEPKSKLQWKLRTHRSKTISTASLCDFLLLIGKDIGQIKRIVPLYFGLNVYCSTNMRSEYHNTINDIVLKHLN